MCNALTNEEEEADKFPKNRSNIGPNEVKYQWREKELRMRRKG